MICTSTRLAMTAPFNCCALRPKPMNCGALSEKRATNNGSGSSSIRRPNRSWLFRSMTARATAPASYGSGFPPPIVSRDAFTPMTGRRTKGSSRQTGIRSVPKARGHTNAVERFNCTLRQRVSRLVRLSLLFSKKLANHIGAIKYFICHYNQEVMRHA